MSAASNSSSSSSSSTPSSSSSAPSAASLKPSASNSPDIMNRYDKTEFSAERRSKFTQSVLYPAPSSSSPESVIIDCDPGIDDAMALFLALGSPELHIVALTIVMGNHNDIDLLAHNAALILHMAGRSDIPVIRGANKPLLQDYHGQSGILIHSANGLGGIPAPLVINRSVWEGHGSAKKSAAQYLVERVLEKPGEITIIALGPLTNIAQAILIGGPAFVAAVKRFVMMGGSVGLPLGNKSPAAEANLCNDPEAGKIVFDSFPKIVMAGLNVTHQILLSQNFRERMKAVNDVGRYLFDITAHYIDLLNEWKAEAAVHDPTAIMVIVRPDLFEAEAARIDVETSGRLTSGQTVADWKGYWQMKPQTAVLVKAHTEKFYEEYLKRIATIKWKATPSS